jgi:hypothetical protein
MRGVGRREGGGEREGENGGFVWCGERVQ